MNGVNQLLGDSSGRSCELGTSEPGQQLAEAALIADICRETWQTLVVGLLPRAHVRRYLQRDRYLFSRISGLSTIGGALDIALHLPARAVRPDGRPQWEAQALRPRSDPDIADSHPLAPLPTRSGAGPAPTSLPARTGNGSANRH